MTRSLRVTVRVARGSRERKVRRPLPASRSGLPVWAWMRVRALPLTIARRRPCHAVARAQPHARRAPARHSGVRGSTYCAARQAPPRGRWSWPAGDRHWRRVDEGELHRAAARPSRAAASFHPATACRPRAPRTLGDARHPRLTRRLLSRQPERSRFGDLAALVSQPGEHQPAKSMCNDHPGRDTSARQMASSRRCARVTGSAPRRLQRLAPRLPPSIFT